MCAGIADAHTMLYYHDIFLPFLSGSMFLFYYHVLVLAELVVSIFFFF